MATYWIDYTAGNDADNGLAATPQGGGVGPKKTWAGGINTAVAAGTGHTVNVIGNINIDNGTGASISNVFGTDYDTAPGIRIQATDVAGNPAMSTVTFDDDAVAVTALTFGASTNYVDLRGFEVDWTPGATAVLNKHWLSNSSGTSTGLRVQDCVFHRGANAFGAVFNLGILNQSDFVMQYCVFIEEGNPISAPLLVAVDERGASDVNHCVFIVKGTVAGNLTLIGLGSNDANTTNHTFEHNTIYVESTFNETGTFMVVSSNDLSAFSTPVVKTNKNNLMYWEPSDANMVFFDGANSNEGDYTRDIGYNVFTYLSGNTWDTGFPYNRPWNPNNGINNDVWVTDTEAVGDPFTDLTSTFDWDMSDNGYTYTLPYDLRPIDAYRITGEGGAVSGAIDALTPSVPPPWPGGDPDPDGNPPEPTLPSLPIGPTAPAYLGPPKDNGDGLKMALEINRNTALQWIYRQTGNAQLISHLRAGEVTVGTNLPLTSIPLVPSTIMLMLQTDSQITVERVANSSTIKEATLTVMGAS
jgi:hypothetical protein